MVPVISVAICGNLEQSQVFRHTEGQHGIYLNFSGKTVQ